MTHALCSKGVDVALGLLLRLYPSVSSAVRERLLYRQYKLCVTDQHQAMVGVAYHFGAQFPKYHLEYGAFSGPRDLPRLLRDRGPQRIQRFSQGVRLVYPQLEPCGPERVS